MTRYKKYLITAFFTLLLTAGVFAVSNVHAQGPAPVNLGLNYAANIGLGTRDIRSTIASIIQTLLGLLGIVGVGLILYGGFKYMTAGGEAKNVEAAKKILINAGIGTLIIISAYAITAFVFNQLAPAIGGGGNVPKCGTLGQPACAEDTKWSTIESGCSEPTPITSGPFICSVNPKVVKAGENITISGGKFGAFNEVKSGVFLYPDLGATKYTTPLTKATCTGGDGCYSAIIASCDGNPTWKNYEIVIIVPILKTGVTYRVAVINEYTDSLTNQPTVGDSSLRASANNAITFVLGEPGPGLSCLTPNEGSTADTVNNTPATSVIAEGKRFGATQGSSSLNFSTFNPANLALSPLVTATVGTWTDTLLNSSVPNLSISGDVSVMVGGVKSNTSFFKVTCQEDIQCGAAGVGCCINNGCVDPKWCKSDIPEGDCTFDTDCSASNFCGTDNKCHLRSTVGQSCSTSTTSCVPVQNCAVGSSCGTTGVTACTCVADPVIYGFDPLDGATGTYLTIVGKNFGETGGTVQFYKTVDDPLLPATTFYPAGSVQCTGTDTWTDTEILVAIPSNLASTINNLNVKVTRAGDNKVAFSSGDFFTVNTLKRPGLCTVYKESEAKTYNQALFGDPVLYEGANLGTLTVTPELLLTGANLEAVVPITAGEVIKGSVPNINPGSYKAQVRIQTAPAVAKIEATEAIPGVPATGETPAIPEIPATPEIAAKPAVFVYSNSRDFVVSVPPVVPSLLKFDISKGPKGQYVTVFGADLGALEGHAKLILSVGANQITSADAVNPGFFDFPVECSANSTWTDSSITFKIPQSAGVGSAAISIINSANVSSNSLNFTVCEVDGTTCVLTPGICKIYPAQGRPGMAGLKLTGEGFGSATECSTATNCSVNFSPNEKITNIPTNNPSWLALLQTWLNGFIGSNANDSQIVVPQNATTGPVSVTVKGVTSNSINFTVADCTEAAVNFCTIAATPCCAIGPLKGSCVTPVACKPAQTLPSNLQYSFITGDGQEQPGVPMVRESIQCIKDIQSPSPFLDTTGNCVNAGVSASFVDKEGRPVQMETSAFNPENIEVFACGSTADAFDNTKCLTTANLFTNTTDLEPVSNNAAFLINLPTSTLAINTWYRVTLKSGATGIRSIYGLWLDGNRDGVGGGDYSWSFAVGNDPKACEVSTTLVTPDEALMSTLEEKINYSALVMAANCNLLNSSDFNWAWNSTLSNGNPGDGVARISNGMNPNRTVNNDWRQVSRPASQGVTYIGAQPYISRELTDSSNPFSADKKLSVNDLNNRLAVDLKIPEIWSISPADGTTNPVVKNFISIFGKNFGANQENSKVTFGDTIANLAECKLPWTDKRVMVRVPTAQEIPADGVKTQQTLAETAGIISQPTTASVLAMTFEETGSLAKDSVTEAIATFSNDLARSPSFLAGNGLQFNADTAALVHPSLSLPVDSLKGLVKGAFEIWIKPTKATDAQTVMGDQIIMKAVSEAGNFEIRIDGANRAIKITGPASYALSSPNNILEFDRAYNLIWNVGTTASQLFINGNLVDSANTAPFFSAINIESEIPADNKPITEILLGGDESESVNHFVGQMDNLAVYNEPLTPDEVAQHFGAIAQARGVVASLHFEDEGATVTDSSTNNLSIESGNMPRSVDGAFGKGYTFSSDITLNSSSKPQYLAINGDNTLLFPQGISVGAWVKTINSNLASSRVLVSHLIGNYGYELSLGSNACPSSAINSACFKIGNGLGNPLYVATTDLTSLTAWHSADWNWVLGTYDNSTLKIYINGSFVDSFPAQNGTAQTSNISLNYPYAPTCIGTNLLRNSIDGKFSCTPQDLSLCDGSACANAQQFIGSMDEVFISNEALSDARIAQLAGTVFSGNTTPVNVTTNRGVTTPPNSGVFTNSNLIHPYICEVSPNLGPKDTPLNLGGFNFGDSFGSTIAKVFFDLLNSDDQVNGVKIKDWTNTLIGLLNPFGDVESSFYQIKVRISYLGLNPESNPVNFYFKPVITSISPDQGPGLQWMTVSGYNFGEPDPLAPNAFDAGVYFESAQGPIKARLVPCGTNSWTNHQIVVEVPTEAVTGNVFVRSMNSNADAPDLSSDPVDFTLTTDPVGAGLCPLNPIAYLAGVPVNISGVRFEARPTAPADLAAVKLNGNVNLLQSIDTWSTPPQSPEIVMTITGKISSQRNDFKSGKIQYTKTVSAGEECIGFHIGAFCPGGTQVVNKEVVSNAVSITAMAPYSCTLGNPVTASAKEAGWPKSIFYYDADNKPVDFQRFDVTNVVSDGATLFARAWADNSFGTFGRGVFAKVSTGYDQKFPGQLLNWYISGSDAKADIDNTRNLFLVGGKPAYIDSVGNLKVINLIDDELSASEKTDLVNAGFNSSLVSLARKYTTVNVVPVNSFLSVSSNVYAATSSGSKIINIGINGNNYNLRTYIATNTDNAYTITREKPTDLTVTSGKTPAILDVQSIFASDKYLYILGIGAMDVINWTNGTYIDRVINLDNGVSRETGGFFDPIHKEIYTGAQSIDGLGGNVQSGRIYKYAGCANGLTGTSCSSDDQCDGLVCTAGQCTAPGTNFCNTTADCTVCAGSRCESNKCTPVITNVTPNTAPLGSWVTVHGCYFETSGSVLFTKDSANGTVLAPLPSAAICGNTWHDTFVVVEVPKKGSVVNTVDPVSIIPTDDAITGKIKLVRGDSKETTSPQEFNVGGTPLPQVCAIDPIAADRLDALQIKGRLGAYDPTLNVAGPNNAVIYRGTSNPTDDVAIAVTSLVPADDVTPGNNNWTESIVKTIIPPLFTGTQSAISGGVDVRTKFPTVAGTVLMSDNQIPLTIYETNYGPRISESIPSKENTDANTCRNAMSVIKFNTPLDPATVTSVNINLFPCNEDATGVGLASGSIFHQVWTAILAIFGHNSLATVDPKTCTLGTTSLGSRLSYQVIDGVPQVTLTPTTLLDPQTRYAIKIESGVNTCQTTTATSCTRSADCPLLVNADGTASTIRETCVINGLKGANGIGFNAHKSTNPLRPNEVADSLQNTIVFETQGELNDDSSGICKFTDIRTTVFNQQDKLYGINQFGDAFFCAGDNCRMDIDYDQSNKPNNQHKYLAQGLSEIVPPKTAAILSDYADDFNRTTGLADTSSNPKKEYYSDCTFGIVNNQVKLTSLNGQTSPCVLGIVKSSDFYGKKITLSADLMSINTGFGLTIGGIRAYRSTLSSGKNTYVLEDTNPAGVRVETAIIGAVPLTSRLELVYDFGNVILNVNGIKMLTINSLSGASSGLPIGLYGESTDAVWDNLKVSTQTINYLVADVSWSRSDELDPQRLIGLTTTNDLSADFSVIKDSISPAPGGTVHAEPKPVKQAQTKIAVEVSSPYPGANVLSRQFPITVFICKNPWITNPATKGTEFKTQGTYNFLTKYCRDAGDPTDLFDDLPAAEIIDASVIEAMNAATQAVISAQQATSVTLDTLEKLNNAQKLFISAQLLVDALLGTNTDLHASLASVQLALQGASLYPDLALTVTGNTSAAEKQTIVYTASVFNNGPADATGFIVTVPVPVNGEYLDASSDARCDLTPSVPATLTIAAIPAMVRCSSLTALAVGTPAPLINIAFKGTVIGKMDMTYTVISTNSDKNLGNNTRIIKATITASSDLQVVAKTNLPNTWGVGDSLSSVKWTPTSAFVDHWTALEAIGTQWVITNLGPSTATNITMEFTVPAEIKKDNNNTTPYLSVTGVANTSFSCKTVGIKFQCTADKLLMGNYLTVTLNAEAVTPTATYIDLTLIVSSAETDIVPTNNSDFYSIKIEPRADLSASLSLSATPYTVGENLTLTAGVTNAGPSITSPTITVPIPSELTFNSTDLGTDVCNLVSNNVVCNFAPTSPSGLRTVDIILTPNVIIPLATPVTISSAVSSTVQDDDDTNDTVSIKLYAAKKTDLALSIVPDASVNVGSPETIIFKITNNNPAAPSAVDSTQLVINKIDAFTITSITPAGKCGALTFPLAMTGPINCPIGTVTKVLDGVVTIVGHSTAINILAAGLVVTVGGSVDSTQRSSQGEINAANNTASNSFTVLSLADIVPPHGTTLVLSGATSSSIILTWTVPGDDGDIGTAASYDIRYSTSPSLGSNFGSATAATDEPDPAVAGTLQSMTISGLKAGTTYYFAIVTQDEVPNVSSMSNVPGLATGFDIGTCAVPGDGPWIDNINYVPCNDFCAEVGSNMPCSITLGDSCADDCY